MLVWLNSSRCGVCVSRGSLFGAVLRHRLPMEPLVVADHQHDRRGLIESHGLVNQGGQFSAGPSDLGGVENLQPVVGELPVEYAREGVGVAVRESECRRTPDDEHALFVIPNHV